MKILLTGGTGQLGRCLLDRFPPGWEVDAPAHDTLDIVDAQATQAYVLAAKPDLIINTAAYNAVDRAESEPEQAFAVNQGGPAHLAQAAAQTGAQLVHLSTDYVFDGQGRIPQAGGRRSNATTLHDVNQSPEVLAYAEDETPRPLNAYGLSKRAGEEAVLAALPGAIVLRTSWLFSEYGRNFLKTMLRLALPPAGADHATIRVVQDQTGCPTYAGDLAEAIITLGRNMADQHASTVAGGIYHYCGAQPMSWYAFARKIFTCMAELDGNAPVPEVIAISSADYASAAPRPSVSALSCARLEALGIRRIPLVESLPPVMEKLVKRKPQSNTMASRKPLPDAR